MSFDSVLAESTAWSAPESYLYPTGKAASQVGAREDQAYSLHNQHASDLVDRFGESLFEALEDALPELSSSEFRSEAFSEGLAWALRIVQETAQRSGVPSVSISGDGSLELDWIGGPSNVFSAILDGRRLSYARMTFREHAYADIDLENPRSADEFCEALRRWAFSRA